MLPEEASIMGEFISKGMAVGFFVGATIALIARKHPLTRKHPNLIGIVAAGIADAISRDSRRPAVYEKLLKLDSPLALKSKEILFYIRTDGALGSGGYDRPAVTAVQELPPPSVTSTQQPQHENSWWADSEPPPSRGDTHHVVRGGPFSGTRTWEEIRKEREEKF